MVQLIIPQDLLNSSVQTVFETKFDTFGDFKIEHLHPAIHKGKCLCAVVPEELEHKFFQNMVDTYAKAGIVYSVEELQKEQIALQTIYHTECKILEEATSLKYEGETLTSDQWRRFNDKSYLDMYGSELSVPYSKCDYCEGADEDCHHCKGVLYDALSDQGHKYTTFLKMKFIQVEDIVKAQEYLCERELSSEGIDFINQLL